MWFWTSLIFKAFSLNFIWITLRFLMIGMFDFETNKTTKNDFQMNRSMIEGRTKNPIFPAGYTSTTCHLRHPPDQIYKWKENVRFDRSTGVRISVQLLIQSNLWRTYIYTAAVYIIHKICSNGCVCFVFYKRGTLRHRLSKQENGWLIIIFFGQQVLHSLSFYLSQLVALRSSNAN